MAPPPGMVIPKLRYDRAGRWHIDGEIIQHARSCQVLTQNLRVLDDGSFVTSIGREVAPVEVEDVAFFVHDVDVDSEAMSVTLSDQTRERLTSPQLAFNDTGELYVRVKAGLAWARFSRGAQLRLPVSEGINGAGIVIGERCMVPARR